MDVTRARPSRTIDRPDSRAGASPPESDGSRDRTVTDWGSTSQTYEASYRTMLRVAYSILGNSAAAEDAVHDAFCSVGPRLGTLDDPIPYLRVAVVNRCRSIHRRESRRPHPDRETSSTIDPGLFEFGDALDSLPFAQRTAIVLRYLCDLPDEEIADVLKCRRSTVRSHVRRGLATLREELS